MCRRHCLICVAAIAFTTSQSQSHPVSVIWHGPIQGGVLSGVSSETVSFLLPLAAARDVHLYHHDGFRNASKFVASLPLHMQRGLRDMRDRNPTMDEVGRSLFRLTRRCVSVSSWDPGYYYMKLLPVLKQMTMHAMPRASAMERRRRCAVVGRLMFETSLLPRAWIPALRELDEIWVPSTFMREIVERDLVEEESLTCSAAAAQSESCTAPRSAIPVRVLHEPLDTQRWFNPELHDRAAARLHYAEKAGCPHDARIRKTEGDGGAPRGVRRRLRERGGPRKGMLAAAHYVAARCGTTALAQRERSPTCRCHRPTSAGIELQQPVCGI